MHMKVYVSTRYKKGEIYINQLGEEKMQGLRGIRCIKSVDNRILAREDEIKEMWKNQFPNYNEIPVRGVELDDTSSSRNILY